MSHIEREHPEFVHFDALDPATQQSVIASSTPKPVQAVHGWLTWITASLMPFSFCENDIARRFTTLGTISVKPLMKWKHAMCRWMESKISETLPESFAIVYDGWTSGSTHYVAMFATFPNNSHRGYEKVLLAMSPMNEEDSLSAAAHVQYLNFVLGVGSSDAEASAFFAAKRRSAMLNIELEIETKRQKLVALRRAQNEPSPILHPSPTVDSDDETSAACQDDILHCILAPASAGIRENVPASLQHAKHPLYVFTT
ncbi:hypothetical protein H257_14670 [Aphanomyces astaci]|uniref:Uncharacterized protein n=1 Tax=Aphanomyces astaci TaxID=112090 RepID=W4FQ92_APHAT|nr:hypothetical protein H257_14670 [Aphanomyces astaci]ETV69647.1 hypothetical protein H257_14670 [Aphanomyces astaci]|eukprot:XP_009840863.1 hypothetical protein H257_14670 [Aphanomyces astaci]